MAFKLDLVGLCTSHPENWVPIIRKLIEEKFVDVQVVAAWDSGETCPVGLARDFCKTMGLFRAVDRLNDLPDEVDGVIVHTATWDSHIEQARPFVEIGNLRDANQLLDWAKQKKCVTGGSSLRYSVEIRDFLAQPLEERAEIYTAASGCGVDEFNYGIHAYRRARLG